MNIKLLTLQRQFRKLKGGILKIKRLILLFSIILIISLSISLASASEIVLDDEGHTELDGISIENSNQKSYSSSNVLEKALNCQNSESSKLALNETSSKNRVFKYSHPLNLKSDDDENIYLDNDSNSNNEEILNEETDENL